MITIPRPRLRRGLVLAALALCLTGAPLAVTAAASDAPRLGAALAPADATRPTTSARVPASAARSSASPIDTSDPAAVAQAYRSTFLPSSDVDAPSTTSAQLTACDPGPQPAALQDAVLTQVNYFRAMSGLEPVTFDAALSQKAQQAALMMAANGQLSHTPPTTWKCYNQVGADAANHSNLGLGYPGSDVVAGYMEDGGSGNTWAGHRWWIQRPGATVMGSGNVASANALYVVTPTTARTSPAYITWPSAGYFPASLEPGGRWSFFAADGRVSLTDAVVSVRGPDGTELPVTAYPRPNPFGSLVFEVGGRRTPAPGAVDDYRVTVSDITGPSGSPTSYTYDVLMFDASTYDASPLVATSAPSISGDVRVGEVLTATPPSWDRDGVVNTYRWFVGDGSSPAGAGETYTVRPTDAGRTIVAEVAGDVDGHHGSARTAPTATVPPNPAVLSITGSSTSPGTVALDISLSVVGLPPLDGTVVLRDGAQTVGDVTVTDGGAEVRVSGLAGGPHHFSVSFAGDAQVEAAEASTDVTVTDKVVPTMTLKGTSTSAKKVRVDVRVKAGDQRPKATVSIAEGGRTITTGLAVLSSGKATWKASSAPGPHVFDVTYSGNATVASLTAPVSVFVQPKLTSYRSCDALRRDFPQGVGRVGAVDRTSGTPVTTFFPHTKLYGYNNGKKPRHHKERDLDADDDGIACETR